VKIWRLDKIVQTSYVIKGNMRATKVAEECTNSSLTKCTDWLVSSDSFEHNMNFLNQLLLGIAKLEFTQHESSKFHRLIQGVMLERMLNPLLGPQRGRFNDIAGDVVGPIEFSVESFGGKYGDVFASLLPARGIEEPEYIPVVQSIGDPLNVGIVNLKEHNIETGSVDNRIESQITEKIGQIVSILFVLLLSDCIAC